MNNCLEYYEQEKSVWHINGWCYPQLRTSKSKIVVGKLMNSWGWATWSDRWSQHDEKKNNIISTFDDSTEETFMVLQIGNNNLKIMIQVKFLHGQYIGIRRYF